MIIGLDVDDTLINTTARIKEHFKEKYDVKLIDIQNFRLRAVNWLPAEINKVIWETDTKEIFDGTKVNFVDGAISFLFWCKKKGYRIIIQTANPYPRYVLDALDRLPKTLKELNYEIYFGWEKQIIATDVIIDDDERFIQKCEEIDKPAILLKKKFYLYERKYKLEANNFEEVKAIINGLLK